MVQGMSCRDLAALLTYHTSHPSSSSWRKAFALMPPCKHFLVVGELIQGSHTIGKALVICFANIWKHESFSK